MLNRVNQGVFDFPRQQTGQPVEWMTLVHDTANGFLKTAHHGLMVFGIVAIVMLGAMFVKPDLADDLKALSPFAETGIDNQSQPQLADLQAMPPLMNIPVAQAVALNETSGTLRQQKWVASWLSKRYRVASDATSMLVSAAYRTAKELKLDPLLILSVVAIESGFNPFAESPVGAQGLMQVMSKIHHDKFQKLGGTKAALNPVANIRVGALILKDYVTRGGSVEAGLKLYVGAGNLPSDDGYGAKVLGEYQRLKAVAMGQKVSIYASSIIPPAAVKPAAPKPVLAPKIEASREPAPGTPAVSQSDIKPEQIAGL